LELFSFCNRQYGPTFSLAAGRTTSIQTVTIADSTPGAIIYYTLERLDADHRFSPLFKGFDDQPDHDDQMPLP